MDRPERGKSVALGSLFACSNAKLRRLAKGMLPMGGLEGGGTQLETIRMAVMVPLSAKLADGISVVDPKAFDVKLLVLWVCCGIWHLTGLWTEMRGHRWSIWVTWT